MLHHSWLAAVRAQLPTPATPMPELRATRQLRTLNAKGYPQPSVEFTYEGGVRVTHDGDNWHTPGSLVEVA